MTSKKYISILFHVFAWALLISLPVLFFKSHIDRIPNHEHEFIAMPEIIWYVSLICVFYFNAYFLIPAYLSKKNVTYVLFVIVILFVVVAANVSIARFFYPFHRSFMRMFTFRIFPGLFIFAISTTYRMLLDNYEREKIQQEKENENLKTELSFLRSQVSPHFMFNVLNNMVALARKQSDRLEPILIELSGLMRYMLYESAEDKVSVEKEIEYLKSYINLQMLRFGDDVKVTINVQKAVSANSIEPMLFIPLVENAFKHGIGLIDQPEIDIQIIVSEDSIFMRVINKFKPDSAEEKDKNSGIGLSNLERRLNLLYPGRHELNISRNGNRFIVSLNLHLK